MVFKVILADSEIVELDEPYSNSICFTDLTMQELEFLLKMVERQNDMEESKKLLHSAYRLPQNGGMTIGKELCGTPA